MVPMMNRPPCRKHAGRMLCGSNSQASSQTFLKRVGRVGFIRIHQVVTVQHPEVCQSLTHRGRPIVTPTYSISLTHAFFPLIFIHAGIPQLTYVICELMKQQQHATDVFFSSVPPTAVVVIIVVVVVIVVVVAIVMVMVIVIIIIISHVEFNPSSFHLCIP